MPVTSPFTGIWTLQSWSALKNGAADGYPMGPDAQGQIIYAADGHMSAFLMRADFSDSDAMATADRCIAYGGTWQAGDGIVTHQVRFATLPHWIGRPLVRHVQRDGDILTLRTEPEISAAGNRYEHVLVWRRNMP